MKTLTETHLINLEGGNDWSFYALCAAGGFGTAMLAIQLNPAAIATGWWTVLYCL